MGPDMLTAAVKQCPFLARVGAREGEAYARSLAANPFARASSTGPVLLEEDAMSSFASVLRLFHGPGGVVPLGRFNEAPASNATVPARTGTCPFHAAAAEVAVDPQPLEVGHSSSTSSLLVSATSAVPVQPAARCGEVGDAESSVARCQRLPFASMSISGFGFVPDPGQLFNRAPRANRRSKQQQQRKPADPGRSSTSSSSSSGNSSGGARPGATSGGSPGVSSGGSAASGTGRLLPAGGGGGGGSASKAPNWHKALGGLIPLAANGHLSCPASIIKMRAAVAALKPVRELRPQALPIRALALSGAAIAANLPCGAWREHTIKFSPQWILAVHATIPFVAMLRKAVLMPKWAILLTVAGAIAGQSMGSRMERKRLRQLSSRPVPVYRSGTGCATSAPTDGDRVMLSLEAGCRQCLHAAQSAVLWTVAPVVTP